MYLPVRFFIQMQGTDARLASSDERENYGDNCLGKKPARRSEREASGKKLKQRSFGGNQPRSAIASMGPRRDSIRDRLFGKKVLVNPGSSTKTDV